MAKGRINGIRFQDQLFAVSVLRGRSFTVPYPGNAVLPVTLRTVTESFGGETFSADITLQRITLETPNTVSTIFDPFDPDVSDADANGWGFRLTNDRTGASVGWQLGSDPFSQTNAETYTNTASVDGLGLADTVAPVTAVSDDTYSLEWDTDGVPAPAITIRRGTVSADIGGLAASVTGKIFLHAGAVRASVGGLAATLTPRLLQNRVGEVSAELGGLTATLTPRTFTPVINPGSLAADIGGLAASLTGLAREPTVRRGTVAADLGGLDAAITPSAIRAGVVRAALGGLDFTAVSTSVIRRRFGFVRASLGGLRGFPRGGVAVVRVGGSHRFSLGGLTARMVGSTRPAPMPRSFREAFIVSADGVDIPVDAIELNDASVTLTPRTPIPFGAEVRIEYVDPAALDILDRAGNALRSFGERVVENEVLDPNDMIPPEFERAVTNDEGTEIAVTLSEPVRFSQLPPGAVTQFAAREVTGTIIAVGWERAEPSEDTDAADYWEVRIRPVGGAFGAWRRADSAVAEFTGLNEITRYEVEVRGVAGTVAGPVASITVRTAPGLPGGPAAQRVDYTPGGRLRLAWTPVPNAASYQVDIRVRRLAAAVGAWSPLGDGSFTGNAVDGTPQDLANLPDLDALGRNLIEVRVRALDSSDVPLTDYGIIRAYTPPPNAGSVAAEIGGLAATLTERVFRPTIRRGGIVALDQPAQTVTVVTPAFGVRYPGDTDETVYGVADVEIDIGPDQPSGDIVIPERTATSVDDPDDTITIPALDARLVPLSFTERNPRIVWAGQSITAGTGDDAVSVFLEGGEEDLDFTETLPEIGGVEATATGSRAIVRINRGTVSANLGGLATSVAGVAIGLSAAPVIRERFSYRSSTDAFTVLSVRTVTGVTRYEFQLRYSASPSNGQWLPAGFVNSSSTSATFSTVGGRNNNPSSGAVAVEFRARGVSADGTALTFWTDAFALPDE